MIPAILNLKKDLNRKGRKEPAILQTEDESQRMQRN